MIGVNPPTDNLYKFIAIAGIALSALCVVQINSLHRQSIEVNRLFFQASDLSVDKQVGFLRRHHEIENKTEDVSDQLSESVVSELESEARILEFELSMADANYENAVAVHDGQMKALEIKRFFSIVFIIIGLIVSFLGFVLWYFKVQRHLDREVKQKLAPQP